MGQVPTCCGRGRHRGWSREAQPALTVSITDAALGKRRRDRWAQATIVVRVVLCCSAVSGSAGQKAQRQRVGGSALDSFATELCATRLANSSCPFVLPIRLAHSSGRPVDCLPVLRADGTHHRRDAAGGRWVASHIAFRTSVRDAWSPPSALRRRLRSGRAVGLKGHRLRHGRWVRAFLLTAAVSMLRLHPCRLTVASAGQAKFYFFCLPSNP